MEGNFLSMSDYVIVIQNIPLVSKMTPLGSMRVNTRSRIYILGTVKPNAIYLSFSNTNQSHDYNL